MANSARSNSADHPVARVHAAVAHALGQLPSRAGGAGVPAICVGLSGGVDSMVLLHALHGLAREGRLQLTAVHVHHGLSPNAGRWASFCRATCRRLGVPLSVRKVVVDPHAGLGIEAAARLQRQQVFASLRADWIALAHHRDDQAETVLLQLLRGAGLRGLSAMPQVSDAVPDAAGPRLLRPLLDLPRALIEACARQQALAWIEDESNADTRYDRNFIRHEVLPLLERRFPSAGVGLARSGRLLAQSARLVESMAEADLRAALACGARDGQGGDGRDDGRDDGRGGGRGDGDRPGSRRQAGVSIPLLASIGEARARELLRAWLRVQGIEMPAERRLAEALRQASMAGPERAVEVGFGRMTLRRYRDRLYLVMTSAARPRSRGPGEGPIEWNRRSRMALPLLGGTLVSEPVLGGGIARRLLQGATLTIGARGLEGGAAPRILVGEPPMRRTLKNLWQESAVPPWLRDDWPLLRIDGELACIPEVAVAGPFAARAGEPGRVFHWLADD
jgi:tRNA(Ile)-lysidine synthase